MYRLSGDLHSLDGLPGASVEFLRALDSVRRGIAIAANLTGSELRAMARIAEIQDITPKALSEFLELTTPAVTAITTGLVERGLIARIAHPNDRRSLFLQLTTAGHDVMETTYRSFQTAITVSAETLDAAQTAVLESALSDLARSLGHYGTEASSFAAE